jgi:hypothetical protein
MSLLDSGLPVTGFSPFPMAQRVKAVTRFTLKIFL